MPPSAEDVCCSMASAKTFASRYGAAHCKNSTAKSVRRAWQTVKIGPSRSGMEPEKSSRVLKSVQKEFGNAGICQGNQIRKEQQKRKTGAPRPGRWACFREKRWTDRAAMDKAGNGTKGISATIGMGGCGADDMGRCAGGSRRGTPTSQQTRFSAWDSAPAWASGASPQRQVGCFASGMLQ